MGDKSISKPPASRMKFYKVTLETRNFSFEANSNTVEKAKEVLIQALIEHAKQYQIPQDWYLEYLDSIEESEISFDVAYRDREEI